MTISIVRVGPMATTEVSSAQLLRTALVSHWKMQQQQQQQPSPEGDSSSTEINIDENKLLPISNKYFTATVLLEDMENTIDEAAAKEDAVILVFDMLASNPDRTGVPGVTFDSLQVAHDAAQAQDTCGDLLRLCVGVTLTALSPEEARGVKHEDEYSRRILWCLDHGYEYIEADLSQEGQAKGHEDRDKDGFARIVEAIQGTVWSGAVMKERQSAKLQASYTAAVHDITKEDSESNPYVPPDPSMLAQIPADGTVAPATTAGTTSNGNSSSSKNTEMDRLRQEIDEEKVFDEMETVLREASRIREQSKCGELTDEERRAKAESAALRLVDLMNHFGMEDEEGGDDPSIADSEDSGIVASS